MNVISGKYKGRKLKGYDIRGTRTTMSKIKEAVFDMIRLDLDSSFFLDLFSGSGAIGIEALSNNAKYVVFNDKNYKAYNIIKDNLNNLNIENDKYLLLNKDYNLALLDLKKRDLKFDFIYLDPPYEKIDIEEIINNIKLNDLVKDSSILIIESTLNLDLNYTLIKKKKYGNKYIYLYLICYNKDGDRYEE